METMSSSIEPVVPRTANLLACKQWWRVCFLYGDQQKYYRQVYGKAAAQRLALSTTTNTTSTAATTILNDKQNTSPTSNSDYDTITDFIEEAQLDELQDANIDNNNKNNCNNNNETSHVITKSKQKTTQVLLFPAKCQSNAASRKSKTLLRSLRKQDEAYSNTKLYNNKHTRNQRTKHMREKNIASKELKATLEQLQTLSLEATKSNARVTVLDDPFLFGIDEDHLGDLIKRKEYNINVTEDISKYFNNYVWQESSPPPPAQPPQQLETIEVDIEPKPALPPKKRQRSDSLQLNQTDLEFLNYSLRNRDLPKVVPHDISFTFNEETIEEQKKIESLAEHITEEVDE